METPPPAPVEPAPVTPEPAPTPAPAPETPPPPANEVPVYDYSTPYTGPYSNESVLERFMNQTLSYGDILKLVAAGMVLPSVLSLLGVGTPTAPGKKSYGPLAPIQWGTVGGLTQPGLNPGYLTFGGHPPEFYNATNPVQSQYYWGIHPYMQTMENLGTYNNVPGAPAVPFGIQQPRQPLDINAFTQQLLSPQNQFAAQGTTQQYSGPLISSTGYAGAPTAPTAAPAYTPAMAQPVTQPAVMPGYQPVAPVSVPQVPQINMNFTPVTVPTSLPEWAPGTWDLTEPVAPYGQATTPAKV